MSKERCEFCQGEILDTQASVICPADRTPYHQECWNYNHGCAVLGCRHNPSTAGFVQVSPQMQVRGKQEELPEQSAQDPIRSTSITLAVLAGVFLFLTGCTCFGTWLWLIHR